MKYLKTTARHIVHKFPIFTRCCMIRNKRRMRTVALVLTGLFLFLILVYFRNRRTPCSHGFCKGRGGARKTFTGKSAFVTTFPHREWRRNSTIKRILRWTGFFTDMTWEDTDDRYFTSCTTENRCTMTNDRSLLEQSDAVLFHAGAVFNFWRGCTMPDRRLPYQAWILYYTEPPTRSPLNMVPLAGVFNWTAGYRLDTDVPVRYGGYTHYPGGDRYGKNYTIDHVLHNPRMVAWMSSNCYDYNRRQLVIRKLKQLLGNDLDLYGACNNRRCPETICTDTISNYKFYLVLENANCRDYITEKFWAALARQQVPVVLGGASSDDYRKIAPPNSFLHINDFPSLDHLVHHLHYLSHNHTAYNQHLAWTRNYEIHSELPARRKWWCELCQALHNQNKPAQVYRDLEGWFQEDVCPQWTLANQLSRLVDGVKFKMGLL